MHPDFHRAAYDIWLGVALFWLAMWARSSRAARIQTWGSRLTQAIPTLAGYMLLFTHFPRYGPLFWSLAPATAFYAWAGLFLTLLGALLAIWARVCLGRNWSSMVTVKRDHQLIRSGPYKWVRHPIYSGLLLAALGTAIVVGDLRALLGFGLLVAAFAMKFHLEESMMTEQFGSEYVEYKRRVKALVPFVI